jgi:hypothetical protein
MQPERIVNRMSGLMPQNSHAFAFSGPLDLEHLRSFELDEPGMR